MAIIVESHVLSASDTDILAAPSRLTSIPAAGVMTIEAAATDCDGSNYGTLSLTTPTGENPFTDLIVPYNGYSTGDMVMHDQTNVVIALELAAGGHVALSYTETGTVALALIVVTFEY